MIAQDEIEKEFFTAKQAGETLGLSPSRISRLCSAGRFEGAFKAGGSWLIPRKAVDTHTPLTPGPKPRGQDEKELLLQAINEATNLRKEIIT